MVINISIHDSVKKLFMSSQCFQQKNINTFDALTFIQMCTVLTDKKHDLFKVRRMIIKCLTCLKLAK